MHDVDEVGTLSRAAAGPRSASHARPVAIWCLIIAILAASIVPLRFSPRFSHWCGLNIVGPLDRPEYGRAKATLRQVNDPWAPIVDPRHTVIAWRLLFPVSWHYLHMPPAWLTVMPFVGCVLALWLVAWLTYRRLARWWPTFLATVLLATLPWFFVSTGWLLHFDSWLVIGLLTAAFLRSRPALVVACLLTPWIDERFVLALPLTLLTRAIGLERIERAEWREIARDVTTAIVASVPYLAIRAFALLHGDPNSATYVQSHWIEAHTIPWSRLLDGLWSGFRAGWVMIVLAVTLEARRITWPWTAAFATATIGTSLGALFIAQDMSRTLMLLCPVLLLGIWLWESWRPASLRFFFPIIVAANLVLPAAHVMWRLTVPLSSLPTEIQEWRNPPNFILAARLIDEADHLIKAGRNAEGMANLDAAIRLNREYPNAFVMRAALRMSTGEFAAAEPDLEEALALNDDNPTGLFLRGVIRGSRGQASLAVDDFRKALAIAPADWPARHDAEQFLRDATSAMDPGANRPGP